MNQFNKKKKTAMNAGWLEIIALQFGCSSTREKNPASRISFRSTPRKEVFKTFRKLLILFKIYKLRFPKKAFFVQTAYTIQSNRHRESELEFKRKLFLEYHKNTKNNKTQHADTNKQYRGRINIAPNKGKIAWH